MLALLALLARCNAHIGRAAVVVADLTDDGALSRFKDEAVKAFGGVDIPVDNAGLIGCYGVWEDVNAADWLKMYDGVAITVVRPVMVLREHLAARG